MKATASILISMCSFATMPAAAAPGHRLFAQQAIVSQQAFHPSRPTGVVAATGGPTRQTGGVS